MMSIRSIFALFFVLAGATAFMPACNPARTMSSLQVLSDPRSEPDFLADIKSRATSLTGEAKKAIQSKLESKEFQDDVKAAPGRAFSAVKSFVESDEVKSASKSTVEAVKAALASDEAKALKKRAADALKEAMKKKA